jgi:ketosteroid isomerase-like protein
MISKSGVRLAILLASFLAVSGCNAKRDDPQRAARTEIEAVIARSLEATRNQDIQAYMALIPDDAVLRDGSGKMITRDQLRADVLRDWSVIPKTLSISMAIDSIEVNGDAATVYTSQRWERLMLQRDGKTTDTALTTQKHKETWRKTSRGWLAYDVEELGGEVFVNGQRYLPPQ